MKATATKIWRTDIPPNGRYDGRWSGYQVAFEAEGCEWEAVVSKGIRGTNVPCVVVVEDCKVTAETLPEGPRDGDNYIFVTKADHENLHRPH